MPHPAQDSASPPSCTVLYPWRPTTDTSQIVTCDATSQSLTHFVLTGHGRGPSLAYLHSPPLPQLPELETLGSTQGCVRLWNLILGRTKPLSFKGRLHLPCQSLAVTGKGRARAVRDTPTAVKGCFCSESTCSRSGGWALF